MDINERLRILEDKVVELETKLTKCTPNSESTQFQRMIFDERGRGIVVNVGGNN